VRPAWHVGAAAAIAASALLVAGCGDSPTPIAETPPPAPAASKKPAAVSKTPKPKPASAGQAKRTASGETDTIPLTVRNGTTTAVTLKVINVDSHDWKSPRPDWPKDPIPERPDEKGGFQGTVLAPGQEDTRQLRVNPLATVYFEMEFVVAGDQDPPVVRLRKTVTGDVPMAAATRVGGPHLAIGWASSDSKGRTCKAVTKPFPQDKLKVTMECDRPGRQSLVEIERL
jgi:hypothetical protein